LNLLERIYHAGYRYKTLGDLKRIKKLPLPVISVGNITTGGTGKTPAVIAIAEQARRRGLRPCILTRGYRGRLRGPVFVSEENYAADVGDEPLLIASRLHDVPVVKCPDRHEGGMFALDNLEDRPGLFIIDDGFQHRRLHRDLDVVLVSATNPFGGGRLLPLGADILVITKAETKDDDHIMRIEEDIRKYNPDARVFRSSHGPSGVLLGVFRHEKTGQGEGHYEPMDWLEGRRVYAFCAIAEPGSFVRSLEDAGAVVTGSRFFRDHHQFKPSEMESIAASAASSGANWIMATEKDIMRLRALMAPPRECAALSIEFRIHADFYDRIFEVAREADA
jgi:tetraacyldisaccharide 4'-kinase